MKESDTSGIAPIGGHLVVTIEKSETEKRMAAVGLAVPQQTQERDRMAMQRGRIVAVSDNTRFGLSEKVGAFALFGRYAGTTVVGADAETYRILYDEDVKGTMDG